MDPYDQSDPAIPQYILDELAKFKETAAGYEGGTVDPNEFKVFRLQNGVYGQRQPLTHMLRVKVPSGVLTPPMLRVLGTVADQSPLGIGHITTRQDFQFHFIPLKKIVDYKYMLAEVGLTTREACGNSVRNVTASPFAGVCPDELFDVRPFANAVSKFFLRNPVSQKLPRKFKPAFEGCQSHDHARTAIHDLAGVAAKREKDGKIEYGFRIYVGGGLSSTPMNVILLEEFTPISELLLTSLAIMTVFDRLGERKNRAAARIKFVVKRLGPEEFRKVVFEEREKHRKNPPVEIPDVPEPILDIQSPPPAHTNETIIEEPVDEGFDRWNKTNTRPQKQAGYSSVTIRFVRGDLVGDQFRALADISEKFCGGDTRATIDQNMVLNWVKNENLAALYNTLAKHDMNLAGALLIEDITSCPGADTCNLGITSSRGLALALTQMLDQTNGEYSDVRDILIKVSGCPNSCGQHHIADIGFYGASQKVGTRQVPAFQMMVGGNCDFEGQAKFGRMVTRIPARRGTEAVKMLIDFYRNEKTDGESFRQYLQRVDAKELKKRFESLTQVEDYEKNPILYRDHGQNHDYKVTVGQGECAV